MTHYKGDNYGAFDNDFMEIELETDKELEISKAVVNVEGIKKEILNPTFPLKINLDETETKRLKYQNHCHLILYDSQGRKKTCEGEYIFIAHEEIE